MTAIPNAPDFTPPMRPLTGEAWSHALAQFDAATVAFNLDPDAEDVEERRETLWSGYGVDYAETQSALRVVLDRIAQAAGIDAAPPVEAHLFAWGFMTGVLLTRLATDYEESRE